MWQKMRQFALVTLITLLIWTWAERESLTTSRVDGRIELAAGDGANLSVRLNEPQWRGAVRVSLKGSNAAIDAANRVFTGSVRLTPGIEGVPATPGEHVLDLRTALGNHPSLRRLGVTIAEVEPPSARIMVEEIVTRPLPVRLIAPGLSLDGEPTFAAGTAVVRLPASAAGRLTDEATIPAMLGAEAMAKLSDEAPVTVMARLAAPEALVGVGPVAVTPESVAVTIKLKGRRQTLLLERVPVVVAISPADAARFNVELVDTSVQNVVASGFRDEIEAVRDGRQRPSAVVVLSTDQLEKGVESVTATIIGAGGVRYESAETTVRVRITRKRG